MLAAEVAIPNTEIKTLMKLSLNRWWKNIGLASYDSAPLLQALWGGDVAGIECETCAIMDDILSVNDDKEDFYHEMMVGGGARRGTLSPTGNMAGTPLKGMRNRRAYKS